MRQTGRGQQWNSGMEAQIVMGEKSGLVHTVATTPANVGGVTEVDKRPHIIYEAMIVARCIWVLREEIDSQDTALVACRSERLHAKMHRFAGGLL